MHQFHGWFQGGSKSQHRLHSDQFANACETTVDTVGGSASSPHAHEDSEMTAPSQAHLELRKGFRMSQFYLQRAVQPSSAAGAASSRGQCPSAEAESADTTNVAAADRRVPPRLSNPAIASRRKKREWWKASPDENTNGADGAVGDAESMSLRSAKQQKQDMPKPQHALKKMSQKSGGKQPPRSGSGTHLYSFAQVACSR